MGQLPNTPSWGVLAKAPLEEMHEIFASFGEELVYRENGGWTAVFCMEPGSAGDSEAVALLRAKGFVPIYRFDYSKYGFMTCRWDGKGWSLLEDGGLFVTPHAVLRSVGVASPDADVVSTELPLEPIEVREALVIEGASVEQTRTLAGDRWRIEPGPIGAIVYGPEHHDIRDVRTGIMFNDARFALWEHAPGRVLEVKFYPARGEFWFRVMKGEECLGTFRPGQTRTWDGTPCLESVEGETTREAIVEKLGIPRSFLD